MPYYRIYFLDRAGHIAGAPEVVHCDDDERAKEAARQFVDGKDIELWDGARLVAKIPRH